MWHIGRLWNALCDRECGRGGGPSASCFASRKSPVRARLAPWRARSLKRGTVPAYVRHLGDKIPEMSDAIDHNGLYLLAESQAGYFTARQAVDAGMDRSTLRHHAREGGRYDRVRRGLYRLRHFPSSPHEHVVAAWLPLRDAGGVVSHESALELHDLSDVMPTAIHISLPRARRGQRPRPGVRLHTLEHPPSGSEVVTLHGMPTTTPERTIADTIESGTQPEQIEMAIRQALDRGATTPGRLRAAAHARSARARQLIEQMLTEVSR